MPDTTGDGLAPRYLALRRAREKGRAAVRALRLATTAALDQTRAMLRDTREMLRHLPRLPRRPACE